MSDVNVDAETGIITQCMFPVCVDLPNNQSSPCGQPRVTDLRNFAIAPAVMFRPVSTGVLPFPPYTLLSIV